MPKRIQMTRQRPWRADNPDAVIVSRPSKWGNPYKVGDVGDNPWYPEDANTAEDAVDYFRLDLEQTDGLWWDGADRHLTPDDVRAELAGKDLACWCPLDQPCHADVLLELANGGDTPNM